METIDLPIESLTPGRFQPRIDFDTESLDRMAESLSKSGLIQPIVVRKNGDRYEILAGERRWRAAQLAGFKTLPCVIRNLQDEDALFLALTENIQRENLTPIEEALAYQRLVSDFGFTQDQVGVHVGKSQSTIAHALRLLNKLEPEVLSLVQNGKLSTGHAKALMRLQGKIQIDMAFRAIRHHLSVRALELLCRTEAENRKKQEKEEDTAADLRYLTEKISQTIGAPASLQVDKSGRRGSLTLTFHSLDELDGIIERLGVSVGD